MRKARYVTSVIATHGATKFQMACSARYSAVSASLSVTDTCCLECAALKPPTH